MNVTMACELQGPVTGELVSRAWGAVKREHPYFASTIYQDETGQLRLKPPDVRQVAWNASRFLTCCHMCEAVTKEISR